MVNKMWLDAIIYLRYPLIFTGIIIIIVIINVIIQQKKNKNILNTLSHDDLTMLISMTNFKKQVKERL